MTAKFSIKASSIISIILSVILAGLLLCNPSHVYAAGDIRIDLADIEALGEDFPGFTFSLYKVGGYDGGSFVLDPDYSDVDVRIPVKEEYDKTRKDGDPTWEEAWLASASALANHIKHPAEGESITPVTTFENVMPGDSMQYSSDENALFLLIGSTVTYDNKNYTPLPIYVRTLNSDETYTIDAETKIRIEPVVFEHSLIKAWEDNDNAGGVRPSAIEVGIYYGDQLIDRVKLGGDTGSWTYTWSSEETGDTYCYIFEDADGNEIRKDFAPESGGSWGVREFTSDDQISDSEAKSEAKNLAYYTPDYKSTSSDTLQAFTITNKVGKLPPPPPEKDQKVKTGDESHLAVWIAAAAAAALLLLFMLIRRKRSDR